MAEPTLYPSESIDLLEPGQVLLAEGAAGGSLHVLITGELVVERDGVVLATLTQPGTLVGEMSVLLHRANSATVRATKPSRVRTIADAANVMASDPTLAVKVASLLASRLDATSALSVQLSHEHSGKPHEQGLLGRIFGALHVDGDETVQRHDLFGGVDPALWPRGPM
jgi:CRP/FNR family transcriptional regulator, cyclic AMP receptor protein